MVLLEFRVLEFRVQSDVLKCGHVGPVDAGMRVVIASATGFALAVGEKLEWSDATKQDEVYRVVA